MIDEGGFPPKERQIGIYLSATLKTLHFQGVPPVYILKPHVLSLNFSLMGKIKGKLLFPVDHLIQQPCG